MLVLCSTCPHTQRCRQLAADAPFEAHGVWGGLRLPAQRNLLPPPTPAPPGYPRRRTAGRPDWLTDAQRSYDPEYR